MARWLLYSLLVLTGAITLPVFSQSLPPVSLRTHIFLSRSEPIEVVTPQDATEPSRRSPFLATVFSAVVPGSGQIYAERYWTIPLIWGFGYWFARQYNFADNKYDEWRATYSRSLTQGPFAGAGDPQAKFIRDFYRDERDRFAFYLALTYVLNIVDAYVGASLYNFDVSEDLTGESSVRMEVRIPLR